jgi:hypothetical protein
MNVFVMMPFKPEFNTIRASIREAAGRARAICVWADEITKTGHITKQIMDEIRKSVACIADVTGQNPNVALEIGYAQALGKPIIVLAEHSASQLFFDLKDQRTIVYERANLPRLIQDLTIMLEDIPEADALPEDLVGTERHERTSVALVAKRVADTPYGFFDLFSRAHTHVFAAAQNHFFLIETPARQEQLRSTLRKFLQDDPSRRVDIMMCNLTDSHAVKTWAYVSGPDRYEDDLRTASEFFATLDSWTKEADLGPSRLTIRRVAFVPFSITFVDPDDDQRGFLVLTPNAYQEENRVRPCIVLSKHKNPDIFDAYWSTYYHRFNSPEARRS